MATRRRTEGCVCPCACGYEGGELQIEELQCGWYVACTPRYEPGVPKAEQQDFWLGVILATDDTDQTVRVRWWNTNITRNIARARRARYALCQGEYADGWVELASVRHTFASLLRSGQIPAQEARKIQSRFKMARALSSNSARTARAKNRLHTNPVTSTTTECSTPPAAKSAPTGASTQPASPTPAGTHPPTEPAPAGTLTPMGPPEHST